MLRAFTITVVALVASLPPANAQMRPATGHTAAEQYLLCLVNRARANPVAEARRLNMDLNEGIPRNTITATPKQPLAFNDKLQAASQAHNRWMLQQGTIGHEGENGSEPMDRAEAAGYKLTPPAGVAENLGMVGQTLDPIEEADAVRQIHDGLFVDEGVAGRGHRVNMFKDDFRESGVAVGAGQMQQGIERFNIWTMTQMFAYAKGDAFLTGVVFSDRVNRDSFYTPGEGIGNVTISATRSGDSRKFTATTWMAGGYTLQLPPGSYIVTASGAGLPMPLDGGNVTIRNQNVAVEFKLP